MSENIAPASVYVATLTHKGFNNGNPGFLFVASSLESAIPPIESLFAFNHVSDYKIEKFLGGMEVIGVDGEGNKIYVFVDRETVITA